MEVLEDPQKMIRLFVIMAVAGSMISLVITIVGGVDADWNGNEQNIEQQRKIHSLGK
jgi:hypothetical protein